MTDRRYDAWLLGLFHADGLQLAHCLLLHPEEAHLIRPAVERLRDELARMGSTKNLARLDPLLARLRYCAEVYATAVARRFAGEPTADIVSVDPSPSGHEVTTREAAELLGVSPQHICRLLRRGDLDGRRVGGQWLVATVSVAARLG